jgi:hypothetical protein
MANANENFNPDLTRRDDAAYWSAAVIYAIRAGDKEREEKAKRELHRLGFNPPSREKREVAVA